VAPVGATLEQAMKPGVWIDKPKFDVAGCGWAPDAVKVGDTYYLVGSVLGQAASKDLYTWEDKGRLAVSNCGNRDTDFLYWKGTYYLVRCDDARVVESTSTDFVHWTKPQEIFKSKPIFGWGWDCESPTLIQRNGTFYLSWCAWDRNGVSPKNPRLPAMYDGELVGHYNYRSYFFASDTPTDFHDRQPVAEIKAHAPEIIQGEDGAWYISSADYPNCGVNLAHLGWK
jgi:beta-fructofuranosidase